MVLFAIAKHNFLGLLLTFVRICICTIGVFAIKTVYKCLERLVGKIFTVEALIKLFAFAIKRRAVQGGE